MRYEHASDDVILPLEILQCTSGISVLNAQINGLISPEEVGS